MDVLNSKDIGTHISVVGWLKIVNSVIILLVAAFVIVFLVAFGTIIEDPIGNRIFATTGWLTGGFLALFALPGLIAGIGLLRRAGWARILAIVLAVLELALFPIGTVLGAYILFVLLQRSAEAAFGNRTAEEPRMQAAAA